MTTRCRRLGIIALLTLPREGAAALSLLRPTTSLPPSSNRGNCLRMSRDSATEGDHPRVVSVAILGGGISGLSCASHLLEAHERQRQRPEGPSHQLQVTVFDTGRLRPGGRCSSRLPGDVPPPDKKPFNNPRRRRGCDAPPPASDAADPNESAIPETLRKAIEKSASRRTFPGPVDHAAQILSVPPDGDFSSFRRQIDRWVDEGVVTPFPPGSVCELAGDAEAHAATKLKLQPVRTEMYYGVGGMGSIPLALRDRCLSFGASSENETDDRSFRIHQDVWISPSNGVRYIGDADANGPKWELFANRQSVGRFHKLVVAHNGKCADRIMSQTPAKELHSLLRTRFAPYVPHWGGKEMTLNSIYSLVFVTKGDCVDDALRKWTSSRNDGDNHDSSADEALPYTILIQNEPNLRLLSCNTRKHQHQHKRNPKNDNSQVWTLLSSPQFGKQFKGPQENLPPALVETVTYEMMTSLERALTIPRGTIVEAVNDVRLQLWGAAVPMNTWRTATIAAAGVDGFVYDANYGVGACGDWILDSSIAGAWESGRRLADWIIEGAEENVSVGLPGEDGRFHPSRAAAASGIGTVPSPSNVGSGAAVKGSNGGPKRSNNHRKNGKGNHSKTKEHIKDGGNGHRSGSSSRKQHNGKAENKDKSGSSSNGGGRVCSATA